MLRTALVAAPGGPRTRVEFRKVHGAGNDFILISGPFDRTEIGLPHTVLHADDTTRYLIRPIRSARCPVPIIPAAHMNG
jgi:hypothetical protein